MPVINQPQLKTPAQRAAEGTIVGIGLTILGLFIILLTLGVWYFAGRYFYEHLFVPLYFVATMNILSKLFLFALIAFILMFVWAQYNLYFFGRKQRRKSVPVIRAADIAPYYDIDERQVILAQSFKTSYIEVYENQLVLSNYDGTRFKAEDPETRDKVF